MDQDFTIVNSQFVIPVNQMSVTTDAFNAGTDDFFEITEDFTISVTAENSSSYFIVGLNIITINIMDDGQSPGEDPHVLGMGKGNCIIIWPSTPLDSYRPSTVDFSSKLVVRFSYPSCIFYSLCRGIIVTHSYIQ